MTLEHYNGKGILIIRDPYKAIKSYRNFQFGGMTGLALDSAFQGKRKAHQFISTKLDDFLFLLTINRMGRICKSICRWMGNVSYRMDKRIEKWRSNIL